MSLPTTTVRYSPSPYTGWRYWLRRLTRRSTLGPTYEFEAVLPGTFYDAETDSDVTGFTLKPVGPVRKVDD